MRRPSSTKYLPTPRSPSLTQLVGATDDEDVRRLDVTVHHAALVHVLEGIGDLREVAQHGRSQGHASERRLTDESREVAVLSELHHDCQLVALHHTTGT